MGLLNIPDEEINRASQAQYKTPTPSVPSEDFYKYRISQEDVLAELEHRLRGQFFDPVKDVWSDKYPPWANAEGISALMSVVYNYANKGTFLANLRQEQILYKCENLKIQLAKLLFSKFEEYG